MFTVATIFVLRNGHSNIWNHPSHTEKIVRELNPRANESEHLGAFIYGGYNQRVVVTGDGRLLGGENINFWHRYMQGESAYTFALEIEGLLRKPCQA